MTGTQFTVQQPVCNTCLLLKVMIPQWTTTDSQMESRFWKTSVSAITSSSLVLVSTLLALLLSCTRLIPKQLECTQTVPATIYRNNTLVDNTSSSKNTNELVPLLSTTENVVSLRYQFSILQQYPSNYSVSFQWKEIFVTRCMFLYNTLGWKKQLLLGISEEN